MTSDDLTLFARWVKVPAVAEWWREEAEMSFEDLRRKMDPRVLGEDRVQPYIAELDGEPVGYIQTYPVDADPEAMEMYQSPGANAVDLFIGEERWLHRGLGPELLREFIERHVFSDPAVTACMIDPEVENKIAIRAYEKAGFRTVRAVRSPHDGLDYMVMRLDRSGEAMQTTREPS